MHHNNRHNGCSEFPYNCFYLIEFVLHSSKKDHYPVRPKIILSEFTTSEVDCICWKAKKRISLTDTGGIIIIEGIGTLSSPSTAGIDTTLTAPAS